MLSQNIHYELILCYYKISDMHSDDKNNSYPFQRFPVALSKSESFCKDGNGNEENRLPFPQDYHSLRAWLTNRENLLYKLNKILSIFVNTHNAAILVNFADKQDYQGVTLQEPIDGPVALFDPQDFLTGANGNVELAARQKHLQKMKEDAKLFSPSVEIREVVGVNGQSLLAFIGIEDKAFWAFRNMRREQHRLTLDIGHGRALLKVNAKEPPSDPTIPPAYENVPSGTMVSPLPINTQMTLTRNRQL